MTDDIQRDLGRLEAQVSSLGSDVSEMRADIRAIRDTLAEARGGWRTLAWVSGVSASLGGLIVKFMPFMGSMPK